MPKKKEAEKEVLKDFLLFITNDVYTQGCVDGLNGKPGVHSVEWCLSKAIDRWMDE